MRSTIVVVPCFNEAERLPVDAFKEYSQQTASQSFLFVDDGSTDRTHEILHDLNKFDSSTFNVLRLARNCGKAEAVRQGFIEALKYRPDFIWYWDADLATPLSEIDELGRSFEESTESEIVMGARVMLLGHHIDRHLIRHYLGRVAATVASIATGVRVYDVMCGAKGFRVTPRTISLFATPFRSRWMFDTEWLARYATHADWTTASELSTKICEVPLRQWRDISGSKVRWYDFFWAAISCCDIFLRYRCKLLPLPLAAVHSIVPNEAGSVRSRSEQA